MKFGMRICRGLADGGERSRILKVGWSRHFGVGCCDAKREAKT